MGYDDYLAFLTSLYGFLTFNDQPLLVLSPSVYCGAMRGARFAKT